MNTPMFFGGINKPDGRWLTIPGVDHRPLYCEVYADADQAVATGSAPNPLAFNSEVEDLFAFHDPVTNNSRLTVPSGWDGVYVVTATIQAEGVNAGTLRRLYLKLNGLYVVSDLELPIITTRAPKLHVARVLRMIAGDYLEVFFQHDRGSNLNVTFIAGQSPYFSLVRVGA